MILTTCAACAAPLAHTAPRCVRCHTRYCNQTCQHDHWRRGHKQMCKKIHRGGNAEQYHADKKYKEAVAEAVEACAAASRFPNPLYYCLSDSELHRCKEDTKGQTCFICTQALHWKTKEGLVRGCACRGTAGFAHVSCLAEQAKILVEEGDENNLDHKAKNERFHRWDTCSMCEQEYHGVVRCALGWACWKTYLGRPESKHARLSAMAMLANGLSEVNRREETMGVREAVLAAEQRTGAPEECILVSKSNLAISYSDLDRDRDALDLRRDAYAGITRIRGPRDSITLLFANNLAVTLNKLGKQEEAKSFLRTPILDARRAFGDDHYLTLDLCYQLGDAHARIFNESRDIEHLRVAVAMHEDVSKRTRQIFGVAHPATKRRQAHWELLRSVLARAQISPHTVVLKFE